ncbi:hypothetical protein NEOC65_000036 [Neochlamydia sp. AcF65]|nr:hypothetical protein [Neochlamydia sp. AcF65]
MLLSSFLVIRFRATLYVIIYLIKSLFLRVESAWKKANFFFGYVDVVSLKDIIICLKNIHWNKREGLMKA